MKEERLYIIGYMACGKTTFGRALADRIGWTFIDLDSEVEKKAGMPVAEIIARDGEQEFRRLESMALKATSGCSRTVVACGGGTPCYRDNMEFMTLHGMTLWLIASPQRIAERVRLAGGSRPLLAGKSDEELEAFVTGHLRSRQPFYCKAGARLSGEHLESEEEIDAAVAAFLDSETAAKMNL